MYVYKSVAREKMSFIATDLNFHHVLGVFSEYKIELFWNDHNSLNGQLIWALDELEVYFSVKIDNLKSQLDYCRI